MSNSPNLLSGPACAARLGICRHTWHRWVVARHAPDPVANVPGHPALARAGHRGLRTWGVHHEFGYFRAGKAAPR